jgi:hypothetical protein
MKRLWYQSGLSDTMALALVIWLCSLVVIGLIVVPLLGPKVAGMVAVGLLVVLLAVCWGICAYRLPDKRS